MAHFARIENNIVTAVLVVDNNNAPTESAGIDFLKDLFGSDSVWKQTSYNANFRKRFAGIGDTWNENLEAFIPPKPFPSWTLNEETCA